MKNTQIILIALSTLIFSNLKAEKVCRLKVDFKYKSFYVPRLIDKVMLKKSGKLLMEKSENIGREVDFDSLQKGDYHFEVHTSTGFVKHFKVSVRKRKTVKEIDINDIFDFTENEIIASKASNKIMIYVESQYGCMGRETGDLRIYSNRILYFHLSDQSASNLKQSFFGSLENFELAKSAIESFERNAKSQNNECLPGVVGGSTSIFNMVIGNKATSFEFCPNKFKGFENLIETLKSITKEN
ncbi:MAG: hypothetical protein ACJAWV_000171 [Flammeovirgaceae bacterium]|jgi:hypothetical protein